MNRIDSFVAIGIVELISLVGGCESSPAPIMDNDYRSLQSDAVYDAGTGKRISLENNQMYNLMLLCKE